MRQFLTLPILVPIVLGIALLILQPKSRRVRSIYIMAASLATTALSLACIVLTYLYGSGFLACIMVRFNEAFSISLRIDGASMVYGAIVSVLWPLVTAYSLDYMSHEGHENRFFAFWLMAYGVVLGIAYSEDFLTLYFFYEVLTLTTLLGMYFMISAGNFLFFFIGLETASIPMATLVAFDKYRHKSAEAGAKYILNAVFASGLSLYGMSLLYGTTGTLYFDDIPATVTGSPLQIMAFVFFAVGLFFKISLVPFHQWTPDVYEGAPTPVTSYLSVISKGSAVFVLMTILIKVFAPIAAQWQGILYGVIVVTTKRGRKGEKPTVDFKASVGISDDHAGEPVRDPPEESQAFSGLFVDLAGRLHHARRDRRDGSRHDLARVLRARLHGVESGRLRRDRRDREPDRQADDSRLQRPLCDASEAEPRDDAGYVLAGRNTAFRGLLQQVLHLRRSRPAGLLYSGADRAAQYDHFALLLSARGQGDVHQQKRYADRVVPQRRLYAREPRGL